MGCYYTFGIAAKKYVGIGNLSSYLRRLIVGSRILNTWVRSTLNTGGGSKDVF